VGMCWKVGELCGSRGSEVSSAFLPTVNMGQIAQGGGERGSVPYMASCGHSSNQVITSAFPGSKCQSYWLPLRLLS
jgi:hypothetical protein